MPCIPIKSPGFTGIICTRGGKGSRPAPCAYCGSRSSRLCDYPVTKERGMKGTCDAPLCVRCTTSIVGDGDLCRTHAPMYKTMREAPKVDVS